MVLAAPLPHTLDPWLWWYGSFFLKSWSKRCGTDLRVGSKVHWFFLSASLPAPSRRPSAPKRIRARAREAGNIIWFRSGYRVCSILLTEAGTRVWALALLFPVECFSSRCPAAHFLTSFSFCLPWPPLTLPLSPTPVFSVQPPFPSLFLSTILTTVINYLLVGYILLLEKGTFSMVSCYI